MLNLMALAMFWGFCSAVIGVAIVSVFGPDDTPLWWWFRWAYGWKERGGWRGWIASPLGGCALCTSGQFALWTHFAMVGGGWFASLLAGCSGVLCAFAINKAYQWMSSRM